MNYVIAVWDTDVFNNFINNTFLHLVIIVVLLFAIVIMSLLTKRGKKQEEVKEQGIILGITGKYSGMKIPIKDGEKIFIGRDSNYAHIVIDKQCDKISRCHCVVKYNLKDDEYTVMDMSSNGVFTEDDERIDVNKETRICAGKKIYLGDERNEFLLQ